MVEALSVRCLRNLRQVDLYLEPGLLVLVGGNGAGKTAVLEALYLLSRGRSFRGRRYGPLVTHGETFARIEGRLVRDGRCQRIGWDSRADTATDNGENNVGYGGFRVRLICDATHALVEGDPALRRRFLDWNVFHVEPRYAGRWSRFRRIAAQRNAWLRAGGTGAAVWDLAYAEAMAAIAQARAAFFDRLRRAFEVLTNRTGWFPGLTPIWQDSLIEAAAILERLTEMRPADVDRGYSFVSLARADFLFQIDGRRWIGSRGETKLVGVLMQLAAESVVVADSGDAALWLVDDIAAELNDDWQARLIDLVGRQCQQMVLTSLPGRLPKCPEQTNVQMFHVEHGTVQRCGSV